jgi:murein L,D-transpeptidase YcbB/YkuD
MRRLLFLLFLCSFANAQTIEIPPATDSGRTIQALIEKASMDELRWPDFSDYRKHLHNFYAPNGYALAWSRDGQPTPQALTVIDLLQAADAKGIHAVDYDGPRWPARLKSLKESNAARFDVALTVALMRYISDLHIGRVNPRNVRFELDIEHKKYYLPDFIAQVKGSGSPALLLATIEPQYDDYKRLLKALAAYRQLENESRDEKPFTSPVSLPRLVRFLKRVGDLAPDTHVPAMNDATLIDAIKHFQERHGLDADGVLTKKTLDAMNVPIARRVQQIEWALERWRWAPMEFATPPIIVNVPEFRLRAWDENGKTALTMRVVVGQTYGHQTPMFSGDLQYVVFRPYWNVTPNIQRGELVPHVTHDRDYLARNGYEVVDANGDAVGDKVDNATLAKLRSGEYTVRQKPGPSNALGLVKFIFPNQNNVYLHSTPSQQLFSKSRRDFSHGCIRVEHPAQLAQWVLRDQSEWTPDRIREAMSGDHDSTQVNLKHPIPVLILYTTALVTEDGVVHFFDDIYGHDATLENALAAGYPYPA